MIVKIRYNTPIGDFKAIEQMETFYARRYLADAGTNLVYFQIDRYNFKTVSKNEIVSVSIDD